MQAGDGSATVQWVAPELTYGRPITGYGLTVSGPNGFVLRLSEAGSASSQLVTGLTNGAQYYFTVNATTNAGTSPNSAPFGPVVPGERLLRASVFEG